MEEVSRVLDAVGRRLMKILPSGPQGSRKNRSSRLAAATVPTATARRQTQHPMIEVTTTDRATALVCSTHPRQQPLLHGNHAPTAKARQKTRRHWSVPPDCVNSLTPRSHEGSSSRPIRCGCSQSVLMGGSCEWLPSCLPRLSGSSMFARLLCCSLCDTLGRCSSSVACGLTVQSSSTRWLAEPLFLCLDLCLCLRCHRQGT